MVSNPMQRKARTSMILGIIIGLIVMGAVAAFMYMQYDKTQKELEAVKAAKKTVYVLTQDVKSGQLITDDMFKMVQVDGNAIPAVGATANMEVIRSYSLVDQDGNAIVTLTGQDKKTKQYVVVNGNNYEIKEENGKYFATINEESKELRFENAPLIAKIDLSANTVVTPSMFSTSDERIDDKNGHDIRVQEYNMLKLMTQVNTGDYIDVRLRMPSGLDYIVISKKRVEIPEINGAPVANDILIRMTEADTIIMSAAIVENYIIEGSMLYVTNYVEPGIQKEATPTYVPSVDATNLITQNPNIVATARKEIEARYNKDKDGLKTRTDKIESAIRANSDTATGNVNSKTTTEITSSQTMRKNYLDSLASGN